MVYLLNGTVADASVLQNLLRSTSYKFCVLGIVPLFLEKAHPQLEIFSTFSEFRSCYLPALGEGQWFVSNSESQTSQIFTTLNPDVRSRFWV